MLRGALLSYKALFSWLNPLGYISSRIVRPIGTAIVFTSLSAYYGANIGRMLVGASLLAGSIAVIFGMTLAVGNERSYGTLDIWLASPQGKLGATCERALPHLADGLIGGLCTYLVCCMFYGTMPIGVLPFLGLLVLGLVTTAGFSLGLSALALVTEDILVGPNAAEIMLMVLSGTLIPYDRLPGFLRPLSEIVPLALIMKAVVKRLSGRGWDGRELLVEIAVGISWFALSSICMHWVVRRVTGRSAFARLASIRHPLPHAPLVTCGNAYSGSHLIGVRLSETFPQVRGSTWSALRLARITEVSLCRAKTLGMGLAWCFTLVARAHSPRLPVHGPDVRLAGAAGAQ
jgi:ABC-2 type transport system permease protein